MVNFFLKIRKLEYFPSEKDVCGGPSELCLPKDMTHSEFCFDTDFIIPLEAFLRSYDFDFFEDEEEEERKFKFPEEVYKQQVK